MSLIRRLFGANAAAPPDAAKLDGTTEAALARSLTALPPDERGWITFAAQHHSVHAGRGAGLFRTRPAKFSMTTPATPSPIVQRENFAAVENF